MCDQDAKKPLGRVFAAPLPLDDSARSRSRRRRLWELPANAHCPVIGVCMPLGLLRRLVNKGVRGTALADDYEIHVGAIGECGARSRVSELLGEALDLRYSVVIHRFRDARDADAVLALWQHAVRAGDVAGALWAALTHPRSHFQLQDTVLREMHMIQHQAGAGTRVELARASALQEENAALARELARAHERHARALGDKTRELDQASAQLMQARAELIARDSRIAFLQADLVALSASIPALEARTRLKQKLDAAAERERTRDAQVAALRQQLAAEQQQVLAMTALLAAQASAANAGADDGETAAAPPVRLDDKTVLCVGGRSANVPNYRGMIEQVGARFAHHDGGQEDSAEMLDNSLAAADLVICQTGCISHNAYWRVKEHCKRTGKQCVFVENPSSACFSRGLRNIVLVVAQA
jgi:hypothetical protein